jgi:hypothetical protein
MPAVGHPRFDGGCAAQRLAAAIEAVDAGTREPWVVPRRIREGGDMT